MNRSLLPNEVLIDISGHSPDEVCSMVIAIIDSYQSKMDYDYIEPSKDNFYSWVQSDGLRK